MTESDLGELLARALGGDEQAWRVLVRGLSALVMGVARTYRLGDADALDVCQSTWFKLAQQIVNLREPARLPAWLRTTARRQALRVLTDSQREVPTVHTEIVGGQPSPELAFLDAERDRALWRAVARLPQPHRELIRLLAGEPRLTHRQLAARLGIPPGSVGPLRRRALDRLRQALIAEGYDHA
ncbi:MAG TPA: sigma-70 family RNA polymerase sigma factor [Amycolatopsis sp.]|uniref:RNA polymerase sigma factor n=1 Tax=Amycolatopsis sp. TaxID=37632 RepID=UPI002B488354|nr:sigma-70 family RNA polymerase sigma factor [Amycolatopsis sp.]HKS48419.1 sigma-70 family RNA polymerase sigma factor [Amycolatopsis sp.]